MTIPSRKVADRWMQDPALRGRYECIVPAVGLAFRLSDERHKSGLTQADVANLMGTSQAAVARLETGKLKPTWYAIERYAQALGKRPVVSLVVAE